MYSERECTDTSVIGCSIASHRTNELIMEGQQDDSGEAEFLVSSSLRVAPSAGVTDSPSSGDSKAFYALCAKLVPLRTSSTM